MFSLQGPWLLIPCLLCCTHHSSFNLWKGPAVCWRTSHSSEPWLTPVWLCTAAGPVHSPQVSSLTPGPSPTSVGSGVHRGAHQCRLSLSSHPAPFLIRGSWLSSLGAKATLLDLLSRTLPQLQNTLRHLTHCRWTARGKAHACACEGWVSSTAEKSAGCVATCLGPGSAPALFLPWARPLQCPYRPSSVKKHCSVHLCCLWCKSLDKDNA